MFFDDDFYDNHKVRKHTSNSKGVSIAIVLVVIVVVFVLLLSSRGFFFMPWIFGGRGYYPSSYVGSSNSYYEKKKSPIATAPRVKYHRGSGLRRGK